MKNFALVAVTLIMVAADSSYIYKIIRRKIEPTFSMFVLFSTAVILSMITYLSNSGMDVDSGIINVLDSFFCVVISVVIVLSQYKGFNLRAFEKYYLASLPVVVVFWVIFNDSFGANLIAQGLIVAGYFPTFQKILTDKRHAESFLSWFLWFLTAVGGLYLAVIGSQPLAIIYSIRTMVMILILLSIMAIYPRQ